MQSAFCVLCWLLKSKHGNWVPYPTWFQETSCHSLEATRIDDIFQSTFEKMEKLNTFLFHCLTPLTDISVKMYSDTKNNLTDVLNDDVTLKYVMESFVEVLLWMLVKCQKEFIQPTKDNNANSLGKLSKNVKMFWMKMIR